MDKFAYVTCTLAFTVYGQLIVKARSQVHTEALIANGRLAYLIAMFTDVAVLSGLAGAVVASAFWVLAIQKMSLTFAYPFMALSFVFIPAGSALFLDEPFTPVQLVGLALIVAGVTINALVAR